MWRRRKSRRPMACRGQEAVQQRLQPDRSPGWTRARPGGPPGRGCAGPELASQEGEAYRIVRPGPGPGSARCCSSPGPRTGPGPPAGRARRGRAPASSRRRPAGRPAGARALGTGASAGPAARRRGRPAGGRGAPAGASEPPKNWLRLVPMASHRKLMVSMRGETWPSSIRLMVPRSTPEVAASWSKVRLDLLRILRSCAPTLNMAQRGRAGRHYSILIRSNAA